MRINTLAIKTMMAKQGVNISKLAGLAGISRQSCSTILARGTCSIVNAGRLAKALGVDLSEIIKEV